jgi:outer membrane protein OmpA-like peptidoglycan-associated protein
VVEYLVAKGIERTRLGARGFGLDKPIATNATALGRAKNRRVECTVLEQ